MKTAWIFDIDGTIANLEHRLHHVKNGKSDWSAFFKSCINDEPIGDVIYLLSLLKQNGHMIILLSGRSDEVWTETVEWLDRWAIYFDHLVMRKQGDNRPDYIVKDELLSDFLMNQNELFDIKGVFEDRDQVVEMYRRRGLRCYQVAPGSF